MRSIAVLGPFRGGTSVATGILQALGVFVGEAFLEAETGYPTFEAVGLREHCLRCFDEREGGWCYLGTRAERVAHLRDWFQFATRQTIAQHASAVGGKHPTMCMLIDELAEAWQNDQGEPPVFLSIHRPIADTVRSWHRARTPDGRPWWPRGDIERVVHDLVNTRDKRLAKHPHVTIRFDELCSQPEATIKRIVEACDLDLQNLQRAVSLVH